MRSEEVFVDTGAWLALALTDDDHHQLAGRTLSRLFASSVRLVTTNHVVGETYTFLAKMRSPHIALTFIEHIEQSMVLDRIFVEEDTEEKAYSLLRQYADHRFSFVDATSFVVMKELEIKRAFAFDQHFATAGFLRIPLDTTL